METRMRPGRILAFSALAALAACGRERGREVGLTDSLTRELEIAPVDTAPSLGDERWTQTGGRSQSSAVQPSTPPKPPTRERVQKRPIPADAPPAGAPAASTPAVRPSAGDANRTTAVNPSVSEPSTTDPSALDTSTIVPMPRDTAIAVPRSSGTSGSVRSPGRPSSRAPADTAIAAQPPAATLPPSPESSPEPNRNDTVRAGTNPEPASASAPVAPPTVDSTPAASSAAAAPAVNLHALPAGTEVRALLQDSISSLRNSAGQTVTALISGDLRSPDGRTLVPSGSAVRLSIMRLKPARTRSAADGELELRADSIVVGGRAYPVQAELQPVPHELNGRGVTAGEAEKVAAGAAVGAVAGGVISGETKGAVIGGVVGAAGGAVVAAQTASRDVVVTPRTLLILKLTAPFVRSDAR